MAKVQVKAYVALIGDIVASRLTADRQELHDTIDRVLHRVNKDQHAVDPTVVTLGDEFQGVYGSLGNALSAAFHIRVALYPHDVRFGLGRGEVHTLDPRRGIYDGSAFWAARDAIEAAKELASRPALRWTRTVFRSEVDDPQQVTAVNAALLSLDQLVGSLSAVSHRILAGRVAGATQRDIAEAEGITASAVSQRVQRDGIGVAVETMRLLGGLA